MSRIQAKRLQKEITEIRTSGPPAGKGCLSRESSQRGCELLQAEDLAEWIFSIQVLGDGTVYQGEKFALRFRFGSAYPIDSPEVTFLVSDGWTAPCHPHVYSNGHICASVLGSGWSPVLNVQALLLTLQSMLASCKQKERPSDNEIIIGVSRAGDRRARSLEPRTNSVQTADEFARESPRPTTRAQVRNAPKSPKDARFAYHDDTV
ncbi:BZ3500_MvSof-1268-A1-R1_Chr1-1g01082 [Microbotryum saponariae]|uniref:BZ3500_MvSof-1268-A1-R1_Chr1-1g01082 protein n=1 Tax=Microbotryum saponariae TaxID=289078 RepID=A0A2X0KCU1_9BASI|nr:BZ3500_MvSof-1268-A1-R1_Chr1-1g01082 [Microbotryum saponariae]SCZ93367.1 BZ3501_MvSof-1269-A2-R1_Chr1-1g00679 [Microbotryum saponariae]